MPAVWFTLKRSMRCKSEQRDVYDPNSKNGNKNLSKISTKKSGGGGRSGCSRSIANLKDVVIHGSKRHTEKPTICSPRSIGSSELLNPITHEVVLNNSTCELKVSSAGYGFQEGGGSGFDDGVSNFVGVLKPGTPGPTTGFHVGRGQKPGILGSPIRRTSSNLSRRSSGFGSISTRPRSSFGADYNGGLFCHKCHEQFVRWEAVEEHHLSKHAASAHWKIAEYAAFLRHGFSTKKELTGGVGVFTASTSSRAFELIQGYDGNSSLRKALIVCRVIAGRVHKPLENIQEMVGQSGFDSLAGKVGVHSNIEELYLLSPRALLPCFVVIYKP
ncbi:hypothetical protein DH2020_042252 [Rehmannia glutinosa]|uniref:C2H2-type domain-containing protein n=1 Tax=Rehmannia glutinosa TaxID=99300 RepID=A0ABR0UNY5_REHGL